MNYKRKSHRGSNLNYIILPLKYKDDRSDRCDKVLVIIVVFARVQGTH